MSKYRLIRRIGKAIENSLFWYEYSIYYCNYEYSDDISFVFSADTEDKHPNFGVRLRIRFFLDHTAIVSIFPEDIIKGYKDPEENTDPEDIVRFYVWNFSYQGITVKEIDKDTFSCFEQNRKYQPKYMKTILSSFSKSP